VRHLTAALLLLGASACGACVSRELHIDSSPAGARAFLNGLEVGTTPVSVPFRHYGEYVIEVNADGREPVRTVESIRAPWYCRFPLGLFSELLLPLKIQDYRYRHYDLKERTLPAKGALLDNAKRKAD
jgi:hypothetical protein